MLVGHYLCEKKFSFFSLILVVLLLIVVAVLKMFLLLLHVRQNIVDH